MHLYSRLQNQIPDLKSTYEMVKLLKANQVSVLQCCCDLENSKTSISLDFVLQYSMKILNIILHYSRKKKRL